MDWATIATAFALIFVAELGDKTQLAVIAQTCKFRRPWAVFLGASMALTAVTAIGVLGGEVLARVIPPSTIRLIAAVSFVVMGLWMGREAFKGNGSPEAAACDPAEPAVAATESDHQLDRRAFVSTLGLLFVSELGDKTQLAVLSLAGGNAARASVFVGGTAALVAVTALGVLGGEELSRRIPAGLLLKLSAAVFIVMGVLMGLGAA
jgi:Ca2+/H+ antiporter, TMEM165/GDT1 family